MSRTNSEGINTAVPYTVTDLSALVHNARLLKSLFGDFYCVVKCCAYGHGDVECVKALYDAGMRRYAVSDLSEALRIRPYAPTPDAEILVLGALPVHSVFSGLLTAAENSLTLTLHDAEEAARILKSNPPRLPGFHIKLDTGMHRSGFECDPESIFAALLGLRDSVTGVYTHFPRADAPDLSETEGQLARFSDTADELEKLLSRKLIRHTAASPSAFRLKASDMLPKCGLCRIGLALYGVLPDLPELPDLQNLQDLQDSDGLKPVMSFYSEVTGIHTVKNGEYIGYGANFRCEGDGNGDGDTVIATAAGGYANGILRYLKNCSGVSPSRPFCAEINGFPVRLAGTPCMDRCMFDVTPILKNGGNVRPGDRVVFFGETRNVSKYAAALNTISYEALTTAGNLNVRYIKP